MKLTEIFDDIYCINLKERTDRWELAQKEFQKIGIQPKRFDAIKHATPWMGCRLSQIAILSKALKENKSVLIFEDDVEFPNFEPDILEKALEEISNYSWDMFYLGGNILKPFYQVSAHLAKLNHCQSTHAYGVNKKFLPNLVPFLEQVEIIIDVVYANAVIPQSNCYITVPMLAIQRASYSDIEKTIMTYEIPMERYKQFLVPMG